MTVQGNKQYNPAIKKPMPAVGLYLSEQLLPIPIAHLPAVKPKYKYANITIPETNLLYIYSF
jgi:hypothetical protein